LATPLLVRLTELLVRLRLGFGFPLSFGFIVTIMVGQIKRTMNGNQMDRMIINLSNLSPDIYTILVFDGREWMSKQINRN